MMAALERAVSLKLRLVDLQRQSLHAPVFNCDGAEECVVA